MVGNAKKWKEISLEEGNRNIRSCHPIPLCSHGFPSSPSRCHSPYSSLISWPQCCLSSPLHWPPCCLSLLSSSISIAPANGTYLPVYIATRPSDNHRTNSSSLFGLCPDVTFLVMPLLTTLCWISLTLPTLALLSLQEVTAQQRRWPDTSRWAQPLAEQHQWLSLRRQVCLWVGAPSFSYWESSQYGLA